jgi:hypothetical protein
MLEGGAAFKALSFPMLDDNDVLSWVLPIQMERIASLAGMATT